MTKEERAELLRRRFLAKGGFPFVGSGTFKPEPVRAHKPAKVCLQWPEANRDTTRAGVWMHKPDERAAKPIGKRNRRRTSPLTHLVKKLRRKLPIVPLCQ